MKVFLGPLVVVAVAISAHTLHVQGYRVRRQSGKSGCVKTTGGDADGACCSFPFRWKNKVYDDCKVSSDGQKSWCGTTYEPDKWGYCDDKAPSWREDLVPGPELGRTLWGRWHNWALCPPQKKVVGFRTKVEKYKRMTDNTGLNGIQFLCEDETKSPAIEYPRSTWSEWKKCRRGFVTHFDVRSMGNRGRMKDDLAATNVRMRCSDGEEWVGKGLTKGSWVGYKRCPPMTFMCGARGLIEGKRGFSDDTGLNRLQMACCRKIAFKHCGKRDSPMTERIVGGVNAKTGEWPWQVGFWHPWMKGHPFCGGALIAPDVVLTAAHCFYGLEEMYPNNTVRVGDYSMNTKGAQEKSVRIKKIILHPQYKNGTFRNDIALLVLKKHLKLGKEVQAACLPTSRVVEAGCYATGWGDTEFNGTQPTTLQKIKVPIVSRKRCEQSHYYKKKIHDSMLCAGFEKGGKDTCQGDSGGPLVCQCTHLNTFEIRGVTSWGYGCALSYGVYADVYYFLDWIEKNMPIKYQ